MLNIFDQFCGSSLSIFNLDGFLFIHNNIRKYSFSQRVVDTWNSLPAKVIESNTVNGFKNQLNSHWKDLEIKFRPDIYKPFANFICNQLPCFTWCRGHIFGLVSPCDPSWLVISICHFRFVYIWSEFDFEVFPVQWEHHQRPQA
jgi:hypothetical protein